MVLWFSFIPSILSHSLIALSYDSFLCKSFPCQCRAFTLLPFQSQETETFQYRWFTMLTSRDNPTPVGPREPVGGRVLRRLARKPNEDHPPPTSAYRWHRFSGEKKGKKMIYNLQKINLEWVNSTKTVFQEPSDFWNIWPFFWKDRFAPYLKVPLKLHLKAKHVFTHLKVNGGSLSSIASFWHLIQLSEVVQQKYERQIASSQPLMAMFFMTNPHWTRPKSTGYSVGWPDFYQNSSPTDHTSSLPLKQNHFVHVKHPVSFFEISNGYHH